MTEVPCPFCEIVAGRATAHVIARWSDAMAIIPLDPVVPGHLLVIPFTHAADHGCDPEVTATAARRFAELCAELGDCDNMISNRGRAATQSVPHVHLHYIPRRPHDGVALPWYSGKQRGSGHPAL